MVAGPELASNENSWKGAGMGGVRAVFVLPQQCNSNSYIV